ncbi:MAG: response regulator transcription factor [Armatimonadetes bacterium]|nr:response regulator transcription factor [Armatimonadota bacterium]
MMTKSKPVYLSSREREVFLLITQGCTSHQVSEHLCISKKTVDFHLTRIYKKLGVTCRVQAFAKAVRLGLLSRKP